MDREEAAALFKHLLVFFNVADRSWAISQNLIVGGKSNDGEDLTNLSSYALLDAYYDMNLPQPILSVKLHKNTPKELYESASIDGGGKVQTFFSITLPLLRPTIESVLILGFIYTFKVYDLVYVMTSGGPVNSTHMLSTYSYKLSFEMFKYSKGSAVANVLLVILLLVGVFYIKATTAGEEE